MCNLPNLVRTLDFSNLEDIRLESYFSTGKLEHSSTAEPDVVGVLLVDGVHSEKRSVLRHLSGQRVFPVEALVFHHGALESRWTHSDEKSALCIRAAGYAS